MKEVLKLQIDDLGMNGEGIAHYMGKTIFLPYALIGEEVDAEIIFEKPTFSKAKLLQLNKTSANRITPLCPYFKICGGCQLQHIDYSAQLQFKQNKVAQTLKKLTGKELVISNCFGNTEYNYRNKIAFAIREINGVIKVGMFEANSHNIIEIQQCLLQQDFAKKVLRIIRDYITFSKVSAFNDITKKGLLKHIVAREVENQVLITLVSSSANLPSLDYLTKQFTKEFKTFGLSININKQNNEILSNNFIQISGVKFIESVNNGIHFNISPASFMQINNDVSKIIYKNVLSKIEKDKIIVNAYSGAGLLSAILSQKSTFVVGVEINNFATKNADELVLKNNIQNLVNITGDCSLVLPELLNLIQNKMQNKNNDCENVVIKNTTNDLINEKKANSQNNAQLLNSSRNEYKNSTAILGKSIAQKLCTYTQPNGFSNKDIVVVLDPPRSGCDSNLITTLNQAKFGQIIYISCNPATLGRDLKELEKEYNISSIQPYDMFPQTSHIETVVELKTK